MDRNAKYKNKRDISTMKFHLSRNKSYIWFLTPNISRFSKHYLVSFHSHTVSFVRHTPGSVVELGTLWDYISWLEVLEPGPPLLPGFFNVLFHTSSRLYLPASLLSVGLFILICMASLTPLSNNFSSTSKLSTLSRDMLWSGLSQFMCLDTSELTELDLLCSDNLAFKDFPVSLM